MKMMLMTMMMMMAGTIVAASAASSTLWLLNSMSEVSLLITWGGALLAASRLVSIRKTDLPTVVQRPSQANLPAPSRIGLQGV